jgi:PAS domain S-box-containing protein
LRLAFALPALLSLVCIFGIVTSLAYNERSITIERAQDADATSARLLSEHLFRVFRTSDAILGHLADLTAKRNVWYDDGEFQATTHSLIDNFHEISFVLLIGRDGTLVATSQTLSPPKINYADRAYFKAHMAGANTTIGEPLISRSTGKTIIPVTRALHDRDGTFAGVILCAVETAYLDSVLNAARRGPNSAVSLLRTDATLLARQPSAGIGERFAAEEALHRTQLSPNGRGEEVSPVDGGARLFSYASVNAYPLLVVVSETKDTVLAPWWSFVVKLALAASGLGVAFVVVARFAFAAIRREESALGSLRIAKDRLTSVIDAAPEGILGMDGDGRVTFVNDSALAIVGYSRAEFLGNELHALVHHAHADSSEFPAGQCPMRHALRRNQQCTVSDEVFWRADGTSVPVEYVVGPMATPDGTQGAVVLFRDITERKRAEQDMRDLMTRQRAVLTNTPIGIAIIDLNRTIIEANDAFCRVYGRQGANMVGQSARVLYGDSDLYEDIGRRAYTQVQQGQTFSDDVLMVRKDGSQIWVRLVAHLVDEKTPSLGVVWAAEDISLRKGLEMDLKRSNAELERFAYVASHDLRQPLRMVTSYLNLIRKRMVGRLNDDEASFLGFAVDGAKRMDRMIIDLLEYSRIGQDKGVKEAVSLTALARRAVETLGPAIADAGAEIVLPPVLPTLLGFASELERLFQNLIGNAIKFRAPERSPKVTVECREMAREWIISIADNGIGIAPEGLGQLFVVFQRLVSRERYEGTGIGLAACRKICEHHGGRIWIESTVDVGTTFFFALPKGVEG